MIQFWKNFWTLLRPFWTSEEKWHALALLTGIVLCTITQVRIMVIFNEWRKPFYDSLQAFDRHNILLSLLLFGIILILAILIFTYTNYLSGLLINRWRKWMTHQYVSSWLDKHTAYRMQILNKNIDNPDQRISQDLSEFPSLTLSLFTGLFNAVLTFISFSVILWRLSGSFTFSVYHHTFTISGYMFWATLVYTLIGTCITLFIGRRLALLNYQQEQFEANFRFGLIRIRESAEQIALYHGQKTESKQLFGLFEPVFKNYFNLITVQKYLGFFVNGYNLLVQIVGIIIALPRYISQRLALGSLLQMSAAFEQVVSSLSFIVFSFSTIANWRAVIVRLTEFNTLMKTASTERKSAHIRVKENKANQLTTKNLFLNLPSGQLLAENLNITLQKGEHILISGKYGSGKSTLLRALANIWPHGEGDIDMPAGKKMFLPQKPYFPLGTLKQALLYPYHDAKNNLAETKLEQTILDQPESFNISDQQILIYLNQCGLGYFAKYLNQVRYWPAEFSLGEQQLIAFVRIFIAKPDWLFLDEASSALDEKTEQKIYQSIVDAFPNMTIISVGHRSTLKQFHHREIVIDKIERD